MEEIALGREMPPGQCKPRTAIVNLASTPNVERFEELGQANAFCVRFLSCVCAGCLLIAASTRNGGSRAAVMAFLIGALGFAFIASLEALSNDISQCVSHCGPQVQEMCFQGLAISGAVFHGSTSWSLGFHLLQAARSETPASCTLLGVL